MYIGFILACLISMATLWATYGTMYIGLADKYGNIVGNTNSASLSVSVQTTYNTDPLSLMYTPVLSGNSTFQALAGAFNVSGVGFTGSPGYNYCNR